MKSEDFAPTLGARARAARIARGLTQLEISRLFKCSQAHASKIENGRGSPFETRQYYDLISHQKLNMQRTRGGAKKSGRLQQPRTDELVPGFDHTAALPKSGIWGLITVCRTSEDTELAFVVDDLAETFGLVGFHLIGGTLKRGVIIAFAPEYATTSMLALEAFVDGTMCSGPAPQIDYADGVLADDEFALEREFEIENED